MSSSIRVCIVFLLGLGSCEKKTARFETPKPELKTNEKSLPKKLIGQYSNLNDSSALIITNDLVIKSKRTNAGTRLSDLDSSERAGIKNDTSYAVAELNVKLNVIVKGDSVFYHTVYADTIFSKSRGDIVRKFKGYYFLNHQTSGNSWYVTKLSRVKNGITLGTVSSKEDMSNLRQLTGTKADSVDSFRPTVRQFRAFIKQNGFSSEEAFIKIK